MDESQGQRIISHSHFGDRAFIYQGNGNVNIQYHLPPARAEAVRVIPYPHNEDMVDRPDLVGRLNKLLRQPQVASSCSTALWGLGGSGYVRIADRYG